MIDLDKLSIKQLKTLHSLMRDDINILPLIDYRIKSGDMVLLVELLKNNIDISGCKNQLISNSQLTETQEEIIKGISRACLDIDLIYAFEINDYQLEEIVDLIKKGYYIDVLTNKYYIYDPEFNDYICKEIRYKTDFSKWINQKREYKNQLIKDLSTKKYIKTK